MREAIDQLDSDVLQELATQRIDSDTEQAKITLATNSDLSEQQIDELVESISKEAQKMLGTAENSEGLAADIHNRVKLRSVRFVGDFGTPGDANIGSKNVRQALEQIDMQTLQSVATQLIYGDIEGAKDIFITHTNLIDAQINDLVAGMNRELKQTIAKY